MSDGRLSNLVKRLQEQQGSAAPVDIKESTLALDNITDRVGGDTRPLNQKHVEALAESIAVLGLIEPLVTDNQGRLLAGGHRRAALHLLREQHPKDFAARFPDAQVPVRMLPFDAEKDTDLALQVEVVENEKRVDYTPAEVRALADRLRAAGYRDEPGRPSKGSKQLRPALTLIFGKSLATVRRYLNEPEKKTRSSERVSLKRALKDLQKWHQEHEPSTEAERALVKLLPKLEKAIVCVLEEQNDS